MRRYLIAYYGFLQTCHFLALVGGFLYGMQKLMLQVSPGLTGTKYQIMSFSSYIDVFCAAPLGILFVWGYFKEKPWAHGIGMVSLTVAFFSGLYYSYVLQVYGLFAYTWLNTLISVAFIPMIVLFLWTFVAIFQGRYLLDPKQA